MPSPRVSPRRLAPLAALIAVLLATAGCSTNPATGEQSFTAFMGPEQEIQVGREEHPKILAQFGGSVDDPRLSAYVDRIGQRLAAQSELPDLKWTFTVLNEPGVNALALPGGYIYVMRGLVGLAENEAELAGVLGHEIGHVTARHSAQRYSQAVGIGLGTAIIGSIVNVPGLGRLAETGSQLYLAAYSRDQELEADRLGVRYLRRAGYDTQAMASFLQKMERYGALKAREAGQASDSQGGNFLATHPRTPQRVDQAIATGGAPVAGAAVNEGAYLAAIDGLIWGDDPAHGFIREQRFIHPVLGFRFDAPPGFRLINSPSKVVAVAQSSGAQIQFDAARGQAPADMVAYLRDGWGAKLRLRGLEAIDINGMAAATGTSRIETSGGVMDLRLVAIRFDDRKVYRFSFFSPPETTADLAVPFQRTTYSFQRLGAGEAARYQPRRIRLALAEPGDTVARMAARMALESQPEAWFRTLNGLGDGDRLQPGRLYKVVVQ
jgi:predicted Zn-dependent protease